MPGTEAGASETQPRPGPGVPLAVALVWPAQGSGKGFCCQASIGKMSQDLDSCDRPMRAGSLNLTRARKRPQPKTLGCISAQAGAVAYTQVLSLAGGSAEDALVGLCQGQALAAMGSSERVAKAGAPPPSVEGQGAAVARGIQPASH